MTCVWIWKFFFNLCFVKNWGHFPLLTHAGRLKHTCRLGQTNTLINHTPEPVQVERYTQKYNCIEWHTIQLNDTTLKLANVRNANANPHNIFAFSDLHDPPQHIPVSGFGLHHISLFNHTGHVGHIKSFVHTKIEVFMVLAVIWLANPFLLLPPCLKLRPYNNNKNTRVAVWHGGGALRPLLAAAWAWQGRSMYVRLH